MAGSPRDHHRFQTAETAETTLEIKSLATDKFGQRIAAELKAKSRVQFLHLPLPKLSDARPRHGRRMAGFDDWIVMMLHDAWLHEWDDMLGQLDAIEKSAVDKPGVRWIRPMILQTIRRNDEARKRWLDEARKLAHDKRQTSCFWPVSFSGRLRRSPARPNILNLFKFSSRFSTVNPRS